MEEAPCFLLSTIQHHHFGSHNLHFPGFWTPPLWVIDWIHASVRLNSAYCNGKLTSALSTASWSTALCLFQLIHTWWFSNAKSSSCLRMFSTFFPSLWTYCSVQPCSALVFRSWKSCVICWISLSICQLHAQQIKTWNCRVCRWCSRHVVDGSLAWRVDYNQSCLESWLNR